MIVSERKFVHVQRQIILAHLVVAAHNSRATDTLPQLTEARKDPGFFAIALE